MQTEVRLFAGLHKYVNGAVSGEAFRVELEEGSDIAALLDRLGIPRQEVYVTMVNGQTLPTSRILREGDRIGIFPPVGGG